MAIECKQNNKLPQSILKINKSLVPADNPVEVYARVINFEGIEAIGEGFIDNPEIPNPCGEGTITGEAYLKKVIIVAGVHYSIILFDAVTKREIYDGDVEFKTSYLLYKVVPLEAEVVIDPKKIDAQIETTLVKLDDLEGVDYYLYRVDGDIILSYNE